ncbi:kyphoscoliosis peptidase [Pimephales promelas]|uniref:kyphoscoliosis peptidase n=1 Tax=Pimephales promelas TaxID=90988 RepID=UPI001955D3E9|nr:kyphoscoliosis peptidase [Pimephales promelas]KAG1950729.1 kyphoscoliosis peptidase [Pimephales promelas]
MSFTTAKAQTEPITTKNSNRGRQPEETATDSDNDTQKQNFDLKVENGMVKCKLQNVSGSHEDSIKVCLTNKSHRGGSQSVEQNDPKPLTIVPVQENVVSHKVLLENYEGKLCEEQRPSTKRQLSAESAAKSVSVRKRSTVKKSLEEIVKPLLVASPGTQSGRPYLPAVSSSQRKPRKLLFSSTEIFSKVDAFSIKKGKELRELEVFDAQKIACAVTEGSRNDLEKLRAAWIWICHNIEYDLEGYLGISQKICSSDEVIRKRKGVCSGYSSLCVEMCRELGIECVEVSGYSKGIGYQARHSLAEKRSDHEWNAVFVGGQWWLLDACWGAGTVDMKNKTFVKRYDDFYFLTEPSEFINSHFPDDETWQLLTTPISMEEFEMRPLKTSAFYQFGLTLTQPTQYKTITDDGEAIVSVRSSRPLTFSYEMRQQDHETGTLKQEEVDSSCGLLSVTQQGMKLRLLPPEPGAYEVKLFARREGEHGVLRWVCSLELECPSIQKRQALPDNPYLNWGLAAGSSALGVKGCSTAGEEAVEVGEGGECKVILHTTRPLMMVCELTHPELDAATAKRCLALQITAEQLVCNIICPYKGFYRLSVFVRDYDSGSGTFQNAGNYLLHCQSQGLNPNVLYPADLGLWCGPGIRTQEAGLSHFSHTGAIVNAPQGRCNITFHCTTPDLQIHAVLCAELHEEVHFPLSRYVLLTFTETKVTVSVCAPRAGVYRLALYGRKPPEQDYMSLCDFIIRSVCEKPGDPFPAVYSAWVRGCVLLEPRTGVLPTQRSVSFRVRVSGAQKVCVVGEKRTDLKMNKSRVWEGEAVTGNATQLKLAAVTKESNDMHVLMTFDVLNLENEL